jgi:hypothetical protein
MPIVRLASNHLLLVNRIDEGTLDIDVHLQWIIAGGGVTTASNKVYTEAYVVAILFAIATRTEIKTPGVPSYIEAVMYGVACLGEASCARVPVDSKHMEGGP